MRDKVKILITHPLIAGSTIIFIGSFIASIFGYLFNLAMGRMLSVPDYGLLAALTSLLALLTILTTAFTKIFAKFSARYFTKKEEGSLKNLIVNGSKYVIILSGIFCILLLISTGLFGSLLHISNNFLLALIFMSVFTSLLGAIPTGVLQGNMRFYANSFLNILQAGIKFILGIIFVYVGFQLFGAVVSILISGLIATILGFLVIYKYFKRTVKIERSLNFRQEFTHYTYTFVLTSMGIALLSNIDIILVRFFFEPITSGQYAALSLMGKAIFYLITPINFVFFPLIAQKKERNERLFNTVLLTSGIVFSGSVALSFIYFAFPDIILKIFFPAPEYQILRSYLGLFSLYILIFSMVNVLNSFFLSIGKTKIYIHTLIAAVVQACLIVLFHESLYQVIGVLFVVNFLLLLSYFIYYMKHGKD